MPGVMKPGDGKRIKRTQLITFVKERCVVGHNRNIVGIIRLGLGFYPLREGLRVEREKNFVRIIGIVLRRNLRGVVVFKIIFDRFSFFSAERCSRDKKQLYVSRSSSVIFQKYNKRSPPIL